MKLMLAIKFYNKGGVISEQSIKFCRMIIEIAEIPVEECQKCSFLSEYLTIAYLAVVLALQSNLKIVPNPTYLPRFLALPAW